MSMQHAAITSTPSLPKIDPLPYLHHHCTNRTSNEPTACNRNNCNRNSDCTTKTPSCSSTRVILKPHNKHNAQNPRRFAAHTKSFPRSRSAWSSLLFYLGANHILRAPVQLHRILLQPKYPSDPWSRHLG